ncbi:MAG: heparinase II/III family protein [Clostridia bacterium]|nr:heparinase II/III family protein [Clostridia bacterium]
MFEKFYDAAAVAAALTPRDVYLPFPKCGEPNTLTAEQKSAMIAAGEKYLDYGWPIGTAMDYMTSSRTGNRRLYEGSEYRERRNALAALLDAEYAENKGRFIPQIINGVWAIMDEASWVPPAHNAEWYIRHTTRVEVVRDGNWELPNFDDPTIIDLFAGGTAGLLAHAYYLFKEQVDAVTPLVFRRLEKVMEERIFKPFMENAYWWTGLWYYDPPNNWNPWILSNILSCYGYMCADEEKRAAGIARACVMLDKFLGGYDSDGGCDEGPSYWGVAGASLCDCLCELSALLGESFDGCFAEPLVQNIGRYIYKAHIAGEYFTNYADAPKHFRASCDLIYRYGKMIDDDNMVRLGVALYNLYKDLDGSKNDAAMLDTHRYYRHMHSMLGEAKIAAEENRGFPLVEDTYMDGVQQISARQTGGSTEGMYLGAKFGTNAESHNHNDVGTFVLYSDGQPVIVDIGSGEYNAKTFSAQRYEVPQMGSPHHNVPLINGVPQEVGEEHNAKDVAYTCENGVTTFGADISPAYLPAAGVNSWRRTFTFNRSEKTVTISDEAEFAGEKNFAETMFIVPVEPVIDGSTVTIAVEGARPVVLTGEGVRFTAEEVDLTYDPRLTENWNGKVWRVKAAAECVETLRQTFTVQQK